MKSNFLLGIFAFSAALTLSAAPPVALRLYGGPIYKPIKGNNTTFEYAIRNSGANDAHDVVLTVELSTSSRLVSMDAEPGTWSVDGNRLTSLLGTIGARQLVFVRFRIDPGSASELRLSASVKAAEPFENPALVRSSVTQAITEPICVGPRLSLAHQWPFDNSLRDVIGASHGVTTGAMTFDSGKVASALRLEGGNVDLGAFPEASAFSLALWVNPAADQPSGASLLQTGSTEEANWSLTQDGGEANRYVWRAADDGAPIAVHLAPDSWQLVVITRDDEHRTRVYLDGALVGRSVAGAIRFDSPRLAVAASASGNGWKGSVDELCLYDRALTYADVLALFRSGNRGMCADAPGTADMLITFSAQPFQVELGGNVALDARLENLGPDAANDVIVVQELPVEFRPGSIALSGQVEPVALAVNILVCEITTLESGARQSTSLIGSMLALSESTLTASVASPSIDVDETNNFSFATMEIVRPRLSARNVEMVEGNSGQQWMPFVVTLSERAVEPVSVRYATVSGSATADVDFVSVTGRLDFLPGESEKSVRVPIIPDRVYEQDESFSLLLSEPVNAELTGAETSGTILNDDLLTGVGDSFVLDASESVLAAAPGVLANDNSGSIDGLVTLLATGPIQGALQLESDGSFVYTAAPDFKWADVFTYEVTDGINSSGPVPVLVTRTPGVVLNALIAPVQLQNGTFRFIAIVEPGKQFTVEYSDDLKEWKPLRQVTSDKAAIEIVDADASGKRSRFYRMRP